MMETENVETLRWSARFQFRTWNREAMLMWIGLQGAETLLLLLSDTQLRLIHQRSAPQSSEITVGQPSVCVFGWWVGGWVKF